MLTKEPDFGQVPVEVRRRRRSCLEKKPKKRLRDIADLWQLLEETPPQAAPVRANSKLPWVVAAAGVLIAVAVSILHFGATRVTVPETRLDIVTPATSSPASFALSPDGRKIAYVASGDGPQRVWVRSLRSFVSGQ